MKDDSSSTSRRLFLDRLARLTGALVLAPVSSACVTRAPAAATPSDPLAPPRARPATWDAVAFNRERGNRGAIPASYRPSINGPGGDAQHLGKHLPYVPAVAEAGGATRALALMWGDPSKGHAPHPNAARSAANPEGHWYDWIRVRKAVDGDAEERESRFTSWPVPSAGDNGSYRAARGSDPAADTGKATIYVAELPADVRPGDLVRIHAHCRTHGEYVDFVRVPEV